MQQVEGNMTAVTSKFSNFRLLKEDLLTEGYDKKRATEMLKLINGLTNCISTYQDSSTLISQNVILVQ